MDENKIKDKNKKANKKKKKHMLRRILLIILLLLIIGGCVLGYKVVKNGGGIKGMLATFLNEDTTRVEELEPIKLLLLGQSQNMTDTIMVCSYDPKVQKATMLSIPRDTFIGKNKNRATAADKINSLYQGEHPEKVMKAVSDIVGFELENYVVVDTKALIELVDAIGGVYFDVPIDMKYDDKTQDLHINLKKGYQLINGEHAEQLLRFRHNNNGTSYPEEYGDNDYGRMRTQREFIKAAASQTLKASNILKIGDLLDIISRNVKTNMNFNYMKKYIPYAVEFNTENLNTGALPGESEKCNGVWLFIHDKEETVELVDELLNYSTENTVEGEESLQESSQNISEIKVEILNGSDLKSNLSNLTQDLKEKGYNIVKTGTTTDTKKTTIINNTNQDSEIANKLKKAVGKGTISTAENKKSSIADFTIIIGEDY